MFGHGATLRAHVDEHLTNTIIIPDPAQPALSDGVIRSWQVFAKEISIEHSVYFQVCITASIVSKDVRQCTFIPVKYNDHDHADADDDDDSEDDEQAGEAEKA